ncbi:MAG: hypothetical protein ACRDNG_10315 [Gaiellaceae bacterium]
MPTYALTAQFTRDWAALSARDRARFRTAVAKFVADLKAEHGFRPGLRVKGIQGAPGVFEMTWAPDGRATFEYGSSLGEGPHIVWRRIGRHDVFTRP